MTDCQFEAREAWLNRLESDLAGECEAWDCNPDMIFEDQDYDYDLDEEDSTGDWQTLVLDRFGDRTVNPSFRK